MNFRKELSRRRARHYSQNGEDGVIERLLELVGIETRFYVELGAGSGDECNTRWLRENGWSGVMIDRDYENPALPLYKHHITVENIKPLLARYNVPRNFDLLSIDVDGNDYWICKAVLEDYCPRVAVVEFNAGLPSYVAVTIPYDPNYRWAGEPNTGQSLLALKRLGEANSYSLVYARPPNAYLVRKDLLPWNYRSTSTREASGSLFFMLPAFMSLLGVVRDKRWNSELKNHPWVHV